MHPWIVLASASLLYLLILVLPLWVVPLMRRPAIPARIPRQLLDAIAQLEKDARTPFEYLSGAAEYVLSANHGGRFRLWRHLPKGFDDDLKTLLSHRGYLHGPQLNHLMRTLLVRSSRFSEEDVRIRTTFLNLLAHQYLQVRIAGQWYDVDLWARSLGVPLGKHAWGVR